MPAKFVNLIEFFECKIFLEIEPVRFAGRSVNYDVIILSLNTIDMGPEEEFTFRKGRNGDPGMENGYHFAPMGFFLAVKKTAIGQPEHAMQGTHQPGFAKQKHQADTQEEYYFCEPEKQVYPGHIYQDILSGQYQDKNIQRHQQEATKVKRTGMWFFEMGNCMCQDESPGCEMHKTARLL
jgi:hypothetical protein